MSMCRFKGKDCALPLLLKKPIRILLVRSPDRNGHEFAPTNLLLKGPFFRSQGT